jgi:hypothetical protein
MDKEKAIIADRLSSFAPLLAGLLQRELPNFKILGTIVRQYPFDLPLSKTPARFYFFCLS